jgi:hypothetical protein
MMYTGGADSHEGGRGRNHQGGLHRALLDLLLRLPGAEAGEQRGSGLLRLVLALGVAGQGGLASGGAGLLDDFARRQRTRRRDRLLRSGELGRGELGRGELGSREVAVVIGLRLRLERRFRFQGRNEAVGGLEILVAELQRRRLAGREGRRFEHRSLEDSRRGGTGRRRNRRRRVGRNEGGGLVEDVLGDGLAAEREALAVVERRRGGTHGRRGRGGGLLGGSAVGLGQLGVDLLARFLQQARGALLALADAVDQFLRGALVALVQAVGDASDLVADVVDGQGVAALGVADPLGQLLGNPGDFRAQLLEGLGLDAVGAVQLLVDAGGDLLDGGGVAGFRGLDAAVQGVGHADDLAAHALDGLGRALLGGLHVGGHLAQLVLHAVEAAVGGFAQLGGHLQAGGLHALGQAAGQVVEALLDAFAGIAALDRVEAAVQGAERGVQGLQGFGRTGLGGFQALAKAGHDLVDQARGVGDAGSGLVVQALLQLGDGLAGAGLAFIEVARDLAERAFQGAQGLGRARTDGFGLDAAQPFGGAGLVGLDVVHDAFEAGGDGDLFTFGGDQALEGAAHGFVDAGNGLGRTLLGRLDAIGQPVQGDGHATDLVGGMLAGFDPRRRTAAGGLIIGRIGAIVVDRQGRTAGFAERLERRGVEALALDDHAIEPFAQRHAGATREVLGDLPCLGVDPLNAPWRCGRHPNRSLCTWEPTLVIDS